MNEQLSDIPGAFLELITPNEPVPFIVGGAVMLGIGAMPKLKGSFGRPILMGLGGILLALGLLPVISSAVN